MSSSFEKITKHSSAIEILVCLQSCVMAGWVFVQFMHVIMEARTGQFKRRERERDEDHGRMHVYAQGAADWIINLSALELHYLSRAITYPPFYECLFFFSNGQGLFF